MRIAELSRTSGVPVATVKHYLREGLLPRGEVTSRTQAQYGEEHVRRLRLVRALTELAGLPLASVRAVLAALDAPAGSVHDVLGAAHDALGPRVDEGVDTSAARAAVDLIGWEVADDCAPLRQLAAAMAALEAVGLDASPALVAERGRALEALVRDEVAAVPTTSLAAAVEFVAVGTVLYEPVLAALRRLGHEDASGRRFGSTPAAPQEG